MIGRLNHVAIAVRDIAKAANVYRQVLGAQVSEPEPQPEHGVTTVFITLPNTKIELLEPLGEASPIAKFLDRNPDGGIHHVCYEVDDIRAARDKLRAQGARVLGDGEAKMGAHGKPVLFLHPKDFCGTLVEIDDAGRIAARRGKRGLNLATITQPIDVAADCTRDLFHHLVGGALRRPSLGRAQPTRGRGDHTRQRSRCPGDP